MTSSHPLSDPDIDGPHASSWPKKGSSELADFLEPKVRFSMLSAPTGALLATYAYVHFLGDPPFCDGQAVMLPIAGGFLGWLTWYFWTLRSLAFAYSTRRESA